MLPVVAVITVANVAKVSTLNGNFFMTILLLSLYAYTLYRFIKRDIKIYILALQGNLLHFLIVLMYLFETAR